MKLHEDDGTFRELLIQASSHFDISDVLIEKDYWVTLALKNLSQSSFKDKVVFKGGTSLSKAHGVINRFSEDIDLAVQVTEEQSGNKIQKLIEDVEKACAKGFDEINQPGTTSKGSLFRKTVWQYPKIGLDENFGDASPLILLEVNSFTIPEPHEVKQLECLISSYLRETGNEMAINQYNLEKFEVNVLKLERTFIEKVSALTKNTYLSKGADFELLQKNVRHFYDLAKLKQTPEISRLLKESLEFKAMLDRVKQDDSNTDRKKEWAHKKYKDAPVFSDFEAVWKKIRPAYNGVFKEMLYKGEKLPPESEIEEIVKLIRQQLEKHE